MEMSTDFEVTEDDIDLFNHMNYRRYIEQLESARAEWFNGAGIPFTVMAEKGIAAVILKLEIEYVKEARLADRLTIKTWSDKIGTKSFSLKQKIYNETNDVMTKSTCTFVMFDTTNRKSIPVVNEIAIHFQNEKIT